MTDPCAQAWEKEFEYFAGTWVEYSEAFLKLPGSATSKNDTANFNDAQWTIDPLNDCDFKNSGVMFNTFVKPVQGCGSGVGELAICCAFKNLDRGDIQYNWETDDKAKDRYRKRFEKILKANKDAIGLPDSWNICLLVAPNLNFTMQGVESDENLASDSIRFQVNEEIHNWKPGKLSLAYGRTTAYQSIGFHILNISNASNVGDQLHQAYVSGTQQEWTVKCPGCGLYHPMRAKWDPTEPHLGGLRYDSEACMRSDGSYDYFRLSSTVRYQMPCGYEVHRFADRKEDTKNRRALSQGGKYSDPRNTGALISNRSRTLEAVSIHYIDWILLIQEKHNALKALSYGNPEPWRKYRRERECLFVNPEDMPVVHEITLSINVKKDRAGIVNRDLRLFALDWQQGSLEATEAWKRFPHWWLMIVDVAMIEGVLAIQIVFEGHIETDLNVIETLDRHEIKEHVNRHHGVADSTFNTKQIQAFCLRFGINAICATGSDLFSHGNGVKRTFDRESPLASNLSAPLKYPMIKARGEGGKIEHVADPREPRFWRFSEAGVKDTLQHLRSAKNIRLIIPGDVSPEFRKHMESWRVNAVRKSDGSIVMEWQQVRKDDHLYICLTYIAMLLDRAGKIGSAIALQKPAEEKKI